MKVFNQLNRQLEDTTLVSDNVITQLISNKDASVKIKTLASIMSNNFQWYRARVTCRVQYFTFKMIISIMVFISNMDIGYVSHRIVCIDS